jgi:hypothetical protein
MHQNRKVSVLGPAFPAALLVNIMLDQLPGGSVCLSGSFGPLSLTHKQVELDVLVEREEAMIVLNRTYVHERTIGSNGWKLFFKSIFANLGTGPSLLSRPFLF